MPGWWGLYLFGLFPQYRCSSSFAILVCFLPNSASSLNMGKWALVPEAFFGEKYETISGCVFCWRVAGACGGCVLTAASNAAGKFG
jgi:hypothetical protein